MKVAKHTPGPWSVEDPMGPESLSIVEANKKTHEWRFIATICTDETEPFDIAPPEAQANARLIAAAPDLLAALQGVLHVADRQTDEFDAARAAIASATGGEIL